MVTDNGYMTFEEYVAWEHEQMAQMSLEHAAELGRVQVPVVEENSCNNNLHSPFNIFASAKV